MDDKLNVEESGLGITPEESTNQENTQEEEKSYEELQAEVAELDNDENPEKELSEEEMREAYIKALKDSRKVFRPIKHNGNVTTNQFGATYKQKRKRRNKLAKASRKANR